MKGSIEWGWGVILGIVLTLIIFIGLLMVFFIGPGALMKMIAEGFKGLFGI